MVHCTPLMGTTSQRSQLEADHDGLERPAVWTRASRWLFDYKKLESFRDHDRLAGEDPRCEVVRKRKVAEGSWLGGERHLEPLRRRWRQFAGSSMQAKATVFPSLPCVIPGTTPGNCERGCLGIEEGGAFLIVWGQRSW